MSVTQGVIMQKIINTTFSTIVFCTAIVALYLAFHNNFVENFQVSLLCLILFQVTKDRYVDTK